MKVVICMSDPVCVDTPQPAETPPPCCDLHGRNCEQGGEECCRYCTESGHDFAGFRTGVHADGSFCSKRDLSGSGVRVDAATPTRADGHDLPLTCEWYDCGSGAPCPSLYEVTAEGRPSLGWLVCDGHVRVAVDWVVERAESRSARVRHQEAGRG